MIDKNILKILKDLWNKDWRLKALVPASILAISMLIFHWNILGLLFFLLTFSAFDVIGFVGLTARDQPISIERISYRIIQIMVQLLLLLFVFSSCSLQAVIASVVMWYFTSCDRMFYVLLNDNQDHGDYYWLKWSVFYPLSFFGEKRTLKNFNTLAIIGFVLGIAIAIL